jgi:hypothetical protein
LQANLAIFRTNERYNSNYSSLVPFIQDKHFDKNQSSQLIKIELQDHTHKQSTHNSRTVLSHAATTKVRSLDKNINTEPTKKNQLIMHDLLSLTAN